MKYLYISLILLFAVIAFTAVSSIYIYNVSQNMLGMIDDLENTELSAAAEKVTTIQEYWNCNRKMISLTVPNVQIDKTESYLSTLQYAFDHNDSEEYRKVLKLLKNSMNELSRLEKLSFQ